MAIQPLDTVLHSMLQKSRKRLIMASVKSNALYAYMAASNRVETEDGGYHITNPLTVGRNPNITSYSYYDQLPVAQTDEFTTVEYNWSRVAGTVIISQQEQDENKGEAQIFKLMRAKLEVLEESIKERFSKYMYGTGTGNDPLGLAALIPDDPTTGTLGGIDRAAEPQWRTSAYDFNGNMNDENIEEALDDILKIDLKMNDEQPDIVIMGRDWYRAYRQAVRNKFTIELGQDNSGKRMMDLGFEGVKIGGTRVIYDEDCPANKTYFINTKYLRMHNLRGVNMNTKKLNSPWNMDASGSRTCWQGQLCLWRAYRTHAVAIN